MDFLKEGDEKVKLHTHSYCCLDYAQLSDIVRYRLHRMKKKVKDELEDNNTIQEYICPNCGRSGEFLAESDKLAAQEIRDADDNMRRRRREKLRDVLEKMEIQFKPLMEQLSRVKDLTVPEFGSLQTWRAQAGAAGRAENGDSCSHGPSKSSQGLRFGGRPMPFLGEMKYFILNKINMIETEDYDANSSGNRLLAKTYRSVC